MQLDTIVCGDCLELLPGIPDASVDAVITDPPYPHIKRDYGYWTTEEWWALIVEGVVPQVRRILKPTGSAVFILQPNSEKVGKMRGWLWEFMAWVCREWNMVQDVWWWNTSALPTGEGVHRNHGGLRKALKACIWGGNQDCYKNQDNVIWKPGDWVKVQKLEERSLKYAPSGMSIRRGRIAETVIERGGVTPFNILPIPHSNTTNGAGRFGHSAGTPLALMDWWLRYIVPPGGLVVDPFIGSGTTALAALKQRKHWWGCDKVQAYVDIANRRIEEARPEAIQAEMAL